MGTCLSPMLRPFALVIVALMLIVHLTVLVSSPPSRSAMAVSPFTNDEMSMMKRFDPDRLCYENQYIPSLSSNMSDIAAKMDKWLDMETEIEKRLRADPESLTHSHKRFEAFEQMTECNKTSVGGECRDDTSKQVCGIDALDTPCVVYSIGGNNHWEFELDVLAKTPCEVHTFDCTGKLERFQVPNHERLHFHYVCLGSKNKPATEEMGELWTLQTMQTRLGHSRIDLLKMDIEGYEWPIFRDWPLLTSITSPEHVLPMQVLVEIHYQTQMKELAAETLEDFKYVTDMVTLQSRLLQMGYATVVYDANPACQHCLELSLVRIKCPAPSQSM